MTFRPSNAERWGYFPPLCVLVGIGTFVLWVEWHRIPRPPGRPDGCLGWPGIAASWLVPVAIASLRTSTARVIVDEAGVEWSGGGGESGRLRWEEIGTLDYDRRERALIVGLVEKASGRFRPLPFMSRDLYLAQKSRLGGIPDVERERHLK